MVHPLSRNAASLWLASAVTLGWTAVSSAEPPAPDREGAREPEPTLAHGLVDDIEAQVQRLVPSLAGTLEHLHVKGRALEFRRPLAWEGRALELRVRGGRFKGEGRDATRGYGLRVELRF